MKPMNLEEIILSALEGIQKKLDVKGLIIKKNLTNDISIRTNYNLIQKSLINILENSIEYSPENGQIIINTFTENETIIIEIFDHGPGFSEEALSKLFEYFSIDDVMHSEGLGLGLAAVKLVMDSHSGSISINNTETGGAQVRLLFPLNN